MRFLNKYENHIVKAVEISSRIPIGDVIKRVDKSMKGLERSKSEIRDAIVALAERGKIKIERITEKRLEVSLA